MSDIERGSTFTTGIPDAASLHNLVDNATILPAFITSKANAMPASGARFIFVDPAAQAFRQVTLDRLVSSFPNGGPGNQFALRKLGTTETSAAAGNDSRFPAKFTGIRMANNNSADTVATSADLTLAPVSLVGNSKTVIDWKAGSVFYDSLTINKTYTFDNVKNGQEISVVVKPQSHTIQWPEIIGTPIVLGDGSVFCVRFIKTPLGLRGWVDDIAGAEPVHNLSGQTVIDWRDSVVFYDTLSGDKTYTFDGVTDGMQILVVVKPQGHIITWPSILGNPIVLGSDTVYCVRFVKTPLGISGWIEDGTAPDLIRSVGVGTNIDWSLSNCFYDGLLGDKTYTFSNMTDGQTIQLVIARNGHVPTLPGSVNAGVVGAGTTYLHCALTKTPLGITGVKINI